MSPATATRTQTGRFRSPAPRPVTRDELFALWTVAAAESNLAYDAWAAGRCAASYAVFVAAEDRASAAQDALAAA